MPPAVLPLLGLTAVTVGAEPLTLVYVKWSADDVADVPSAVVTVISIVPAASGGAVATRTVSE
jgi:hypothetical protein